VEKRKKKTLPVSLSRVKQEIGDTKKGKLDDKSRRRASERKAKLQKLLAAGTGRCKASFSFKKIFFL